MVLFVGEGWNGVKQWSVDLLGISIVLLTQLVTAGDFKGWCAVRTLQMYSVDRYPLP